MAERFTLLEKVGRGGMGVVWKARDEETGKIVALKLLHTAYSDDPDYITRFERELELASRIKSSNVVGVRGYGVREGTPYLALEFVDGQTLRQRLAEHGPYSWDDAKPLIAQLAKGLADAHAAGVVHRDIKPSNVLIGSDGVAKITDFGIARGLDLTRVTGTSTLLGTPAYLPPEGPQDERSDLYSLGIVAYELMAGVPPFEGSTFAEVLMAHVRLAPDLEKIPAQARPIVGSLLEKDPKDRPQSASELVDALEGKRKGAVLAPVVPAYARFAEPRPPISATEKTSVGRRRRPELVAAGVVCALLLAVTTVAAGSQIFAAAAPSMATTGSISTDQAILSATTASPSRHSTPKGVQALTHTPTNLPTPKPPVTRKPTPKPSATRKPTSMPSPGPSSRPS